MRYYGGGVGHVDPRKIEEAEGNLVEVEDEGPHPDHGYNDAEESDNTDDDADSPSDPGGSSDEETANVCIKCMLNGRICIIQRLEPLTMDFVKFGILTSSSHCLMNPSSPTNGLVRIGASSHA